MTIAIIILALFCAIGGYVIGLRRGHETTKNDYEDGWNDAADFYESTFELTPIERIMDELGELELKRMKEENAKEVLRQIEELMEDE